MYDSYRPLFADVSGYAAAFAKSGFDRTAAERIRERLAGLENCPLSDVFRIFGANDAERCTVMLGAAACFDRRTAETLAGLCGAPAGSITPELVCEMFFGVSDIFPLTDGDSLSEYSPADRVFDGAEPRFGACMTLKSFAARFIANGSIDDETFLPEKNYGGDSFISGIIRAEKEIRAAVTQGNGIAVFVCGEEGSGRRTAAAAALSAAGHDHVMLRADTDFDRGRVKELAAKLLLLEAVPIVVQSGHTSDAQFLRFVDMLSAEVGNVIAVCGEDADISGVSPETVTVRTEPPAPDEQYRVWESELRGYRTDGTVDISELAGEFGFTAGGIKKALRYAEMFAENGILSAADVKNGCLRSVNTGMGSKAVKIDRVFGWDDLVLPEHSKRQLKTACDQVRYRHKVYETWGFSGKIPYGRSVSMVFTGPPGTGKTMAAQVIAADLGIDIYRVNLANVVSKYIGETEKHLDEIFDKAKKSRTVLFFDEADVLFSKRTEVKDSNDKYSNMEAAFLLQKIEEYNGIVILATNIVQNFDEAFKRRMKLMIEFPFPDRASRAEMWKRAFPEKLPLDELDLDYLVNCFELSGSNIRNIALHSAFLAAAENAESVGMKHVIAALKNEYSKSGKAFTRAEAGEYYYYIDE